jgi:hypothetical protein
MTNIMYSPSPLVVDGVTMWHLAPELDETFDPTDWVDFLGSALTYRWQRNRLYDWYYRGEHRLWFGPTQAQVVYRRLLGESRSNWAELIVDAVNERLRVIGFRFQQSGDETADLAVWDDVWQANNLDARSDEMHIEALVWGTAYAICWPNEVGDVKVTAEHPSECITYAPANDRHQTTMGLKRWCDDNGYWHATLYTPVFIYKYTASSAVGVAGTMPPTGSWYERETAGEPWPLPNPYGVVPMIEFPNNPRLLTGGRSELSGGVIEMCDRINETVFNRMLAAQFSAFRQKWISGMEIPRDPATGAPVEPFRAAVDRLWMTENPDATFGEFSEASLQNYIGAAEADIAHLASITRTPAYYLLPRGQMPSGEALKAAEVGLVNKVKRRQRFFGEAWEQVMRTALTMQGSSQAMDSSCETLWQDPEQKSDSQVGDMLIKLAQIGTPKETLWELSGFFSPQQIARMKQQAADEALAAAQIAEPVVPPKGPPIEGGPQPVLPPGHTSPPAPTSGMVDQTTSGGQR